MSSKKRRTTEQNLMFDSIPSDAHVDREKNKARDLRRSEWWKRRCSNGECHYCGAWVAPKELTMDHVVPLARGGKSTKSNVVPSCKECNSRKKHLLPIEWDEYLAILGKQ